MNILKTMVIAGAAVLALWTAGNARADSTDDAFLAALAIGHVGIDLTGSSKIAVAHTVCAAYDAGYGDLEIIDDIYQHNKSSLTNWEAGYFVGAAVSAYCPKYNVSQPTHLNHAV
jgi:hypothetical protein